MEIELWNGDWGLPTIEGNCLQVLSLIKFSGVARVEIHYINNPFSASDRRLPSVNFSKKHFHEFEEIRSLLISKNFSPDLNLNPKQTSESFAYRRMVEEKLLPALRYTWWLDSKNYERVTRPWYAKVLPFPFNFYYPSRYKRENEDVIRGLYGEMEESNVEIEIYREAEKCLTCLSNRLGDNDFFYGSSPSSLDAFVYGYLAPLMKAPLPSNVLQNHAKASTNLFRFVGRVTQRYFPHELQEYEKKRQEEAEANQSEKSSDFLPNKRRNQILAALFATVASLCFGLYHGVFTISFSSTKDSEDEALYEIDVSPD